MADVLFVIIIRQFWSRRLFFGMQALKKTWGHMLTIKIDTTGCTGLTGMHGLVRPVWETLPKCKFDFTVA
jgi:hypothetical protein